MTTKRNGPIIEVRDRLNDRKTRLQDRFELEVQSGVNGSETVRVGADLFWEQVSEYEDRGLIWARGTGIALQRESIPALVRLLVDYLGKGQA